MCTPAECRPNICSSSCTTSRKPRGFHPVCYSTDTLFLALPTPHPHHASPNTTPFHPRLSPLLSHVPRSSDTRLPFCSASLICHPIFPTHVHAYRYKLYTAISPVRAGAAGRPQRSRIIKRVWDPAFAPVSLALVWQRVALPQCDTLPTEEPSRLTAIIATPRFVNGRYSGFFLVLKNVFASTITSILFGTIFIVYLHRVIAHFYMQLFQRSVSMSNEPSTGVLQLL